ncbi:MAG: TrmH family RNA methyltransferase [Planctomycetota bacterium]|jgi:tRNA G18 (ribose-2'-O)-methylase SpoU
MPLIELNEIDDPRLHVYRHLKKTNLTRWSGQFIAEGKKLVVQLLESDFEVESVLTSEKFVDKLEPFTTGRRADVPIYVLPHRLAQMLVGQKFHAGMLGCGIRHEPPSLTELATPDRRHLFAACAGTENPDNIGAIVRIAAAFGVTAVLLGSGCSDPFSRRALRVSMGNALHVPLLECGDQLVSDLLHLRETCDVDIVATVLADSAEPLRHVSTEKSVVVLLGNEDAGLSKEFIQLATHHVTIPMHDGTDSLNVAVASAIFLHHFAS